MAAQGRNPRSRDPLADEGYLLNERAGPFGNCIPNARKKAALDEQAVKGR